jgi:hypothetical protein
VSTGDRRSVHLCGHESPDAQEIGSLVRLFGESRKENSPKFAWSLVGGVQDVPNGGCADRGRHVR